MCRRNWSLCLKDSTWGLPCNINIGMAALGNGTINLRPPDCLLALASCSPGPSDLPWGSPHQNKHVCVAAPSGASPPDDSQPSASREQDLPLLSSPPPPSPPFVDHVRLCCCPPGLQTHRLRKCESINKESCTELLCTYVCMRLIPVMTLLDNVLRCNCET